MYYNGRGVRQNKSLAKEYFGKACYNGFQNACKNYRILNEQGY
jgi:TPR repeat protein